MNCKPGDLAIMINSFADNNGKLYRVLEFIGKASVRAALNNVTLFSDCWQVECLCNTTAVSGRSYRPGEIGYASDAQLRPIRDPGDDARDEMLRPLPHKEIA